MKNFHSEWVLLEASLYIFVFAVIVPHLRAVHGYMKDTPFELSYERHRVKAMPNQQWHQLWRTLHSQVGTRILRSFGIRGIGFLG